MIDVEASNLSIETLVIKRFGKRHMGRHIWLNAVMTRNSLDATSANVTVALVLPIWSFYECGSRRIWTDESLLDIGSLDLKERNWRYIVLGHAQKFE